LKALGAQHVGERSEKELIAAFVDRIAELKPQLVTFTGSSFDLPVLRYRAMVHKVPAFGLSVRPYFHRYTDDAVDLCDVLSSFSPGAKCTLHELCRVMGLPGKPDGINGADVDQYFREGRLREIADYCEGDVVNTYRVWLRHELFRANLTHAGLEGSEAILEEFIKARINTKPHLGGLIATQS
jgi:predicted PolB exonuclease-like 3'-5' exonuclease